MRKFFILLLTLLSILLHGCSFDFNNGDNSENNVDNTLGKDYYDELHTENLYDDLFDLKNKIEIKVNIKETEIKKIEEDFQKYGSEGNIYRVADSLQITITYPDSYTSVYKIEDIGIRMKGNTSRHSFYNNGIRDFIHFKISFQETFDDEKLYKKSELISWDSLEERENRKNRTFFGLRALELKYNAEGDLTYSKDVYASKIYREYGVLAQQTTIGILNMNIGNKSSLSGTLGLYKIYEPLDRIFIKRNFPKNNNDGELYKATWGSAKGMPTLNTKSSKSYGVDDSMPGETKSVSYDLKTNKKKSNHQNISNLLNWINSSSKDISNEVSKYIDEDSFITWLAIMYLSGDWDNFMYDSNNFFMYFDESGICYFMPFDMDRTFGLLSKHRGMATIKPLDKYNLQGDNNRSNLLKKTIDVKGSVIQKKYLERIKEISTGVLNKDKFEEVYYNIYNNYKDDVRPTIQTLEYRYETDVDQNTFYHLIHEELITLNDSTNYNYTYSEYIKQKQRIVDRNIG